MICEHSQTEHGRYYISCTFWNWSLNLEWAINFLHCDFYQNLRYVNEWDEGSLLTKMHILQYNMTDMTYVTVTHNLHIHCLHSFVKAIYFDRNNNGEMYNMSHRIIAYWFECDVGIKLCISENCEMLQDDKSYTFCIIWQMHKSSFLTLVDKP